MHRYCIYQVECNLALRQGFIEIKSIKGVVMFEFLLSIFYHFYNILPNTTYINTHKVHSSYVRWGKYEATYIRSINTCTIEIVQEHLSLYKGEHTILDLQSPSLFKKGVNHVK